MEVKPPSSTAKPVAAIISNMPQATPSTRIQKAED